MQTSFKDLIAHNPKIGDFLTEETYDFIGHSNDKTVEVLGNVWRKNLKQNLPLFEKHGLVNDNCGGFGSNKAVIGIGAGPSLKKNIEYLKQINHWNAQFPFEAQPFLFICSNHQFKSCLNEGIVPHFVILVDASDSESIFNQLCKHIPQRGKNVPLICSLHANPKLLRVWNKRGGLIQFYAPMGEHVKEELGDGIEKKQILQGGNVLNVAWVASLSCFGSQIFMTVGNDLSYPIAEDLDQRRKGYYWDGDYSSNLASKRDEAGRQYKWLGFDVAENIFTGEPQINFKPRATVQSLFNYKNWLEVNIGIQDASAASFHYYNCSEEGILGVVSSGNDDLDDPASWRLLDEIFPKRFHTTSLKNAVSQYLTMRNICQTRKATVLGAGHAIV